ncbi:MAG: GNAT family N-acetyltransferase [Chloroflexi bacterium]|nr:GNAT family N-acetyltransferase [Chloroflexota bacterium]
MLADNILQLRPINDDDLSFLCRLYHTTRQKEMEQATWWTPEQKGAFLDQQFNAQHVYYMAEFPEAAFDIILRCDEPIGRLYIDRRADEIRIIDIALLPKYRNQGIGSRYMQTILAEGEQTDLPVRIHVAQHNPALRLYARLGFHKIGDTGVYFLMEWVPGQFTSAS